MGGWEHIQGAGHKLSLQQLVFRSDMITRFLPQGPHFPDRLETPEDMKVALSLPLPPPYPPSFPSLETVSGCGCSEGTRLRVLRHFPHQTKTGGESPSHWFLWSSREHASYVMNSSLLLSPSPPNPPPPPLPPSPLVVDSHVLHDRRRRQSHP